MLRASECTTSAPESCAATPFATSDPFTASAPTPEVTFPTSRAVGPGQDYDLSVSDPDGGGRLQVQWVPDDSASAPAQQDIARNGTTTLTVLSDGTGTLEVRRCASSAVDPDQCGYVELSRRLEVDRTVSSSGAVLTPVIGLGDAQVTVRVTVSDPGTYAFSWLLLSSTDEEIYGYLEADRTISGSTSDYHLNIPPGLAEGSYHLSGTMVRRTASGEFPSDLDGTLAFDIDGTGPEVGQVTTSATEVFPAVDGYLDTVEVTATGQSEAWQPVTFQVQDSHGAVVRTEEHADTTPGEAVFEWDGRDDAGDVVPEGEYSFVVLAQDSVGNESNPVSGGSVTVSHQRLVAKRFTRAISATDSLIARSVGRCSVLRRPSAHRWRESIGLLSGYRCHSRRARDLLVSTVHSVQLPRVTGPGRYWSINVKAYGGAALTRRRSTGTIRYFAADRRSGSVRTLSRRVGYHAGYTRHATGLVRSDGTFRWGTYTTGYRQYDVKHFVVTLSYAVLE